MASGEVGAGLVGSGLIGRVHAEAFALSPLTSVRAVASKSPDGRAVLEIIYAAYRAARVGRVKLPLRLTDAEAAQPPFTQLDPG